MKDNQRKHEEGRAATLGVRATGDIVVNLRIAEDIIITPISKLVLDNDFKARWALPDVRIKISARTAKFNIINTRFEKELWMDTDRNYYLYGTKKNKDGRVISHHFTRISEIAFAHQAGRNALRIKQQNKRLNVYFVDHKHKGVTWYDNFFYLSKEYMFGKGRFGSKFNHYICAI